MRIASHILALLLAFSSIAVPCLAKIPNGDSGIVEASGSVYIIGTGRQSCSGPCLKAILSRQNDAEPAIVIVQGFDKFVPAALQRVIKPEPAQICFSIPPNAQTTFPVDLYSLCRQLN